MKALTYLGLFLIVCGHVFWWVEKGKHLISANYFPGIFQSLWYVMVTMTTVGYGDIVPRKWVGRVMAFLVMLIGIGFFGWAVAQLSSAITLQKLHSDISHHQDLRKRVVATVEGTTSVDALDDLGAVVVPVKVIDNAIEKLLQRCIIAEGVLAIQNGMNHNIIKEHILSLFGEDSYASYENEFGDGKADCMKAFFKKIQKARAATPLSSKLGHSILQLNDQSIQQCLKEISTVDLARALKGIDGQAQIKVFKNLPKRSAAILQETVEHLDLMRESEMTEAQEKMLLVIADLEKQPDELISTN